MSTALHTFLFQTNLHNFVFFTVTAEISQQSQHTVHRQLRARKQFNSSGCHPLLDQRGGGKVSFLVPSLPRH